jgi:hypothetical protein
VSDVLLKISDRSLFDLNTSEQAVPRAKKLTPSKRTNFVDNEIKTPQYLELEMQLALNVG